MSRVRGSRAAKLRSLPNPSDRMKREVVLLLISGVVGVAVARRWASVGAATGFEHFSLRMCTGVKEHERPRSPRGKYRVLL